MDSSSKNINALVPYTGKKGTDLIDEKIDERILRMIGLEDVFDIDYDTYSSLLRERMAASRMTKKSLPTEEVELITDEWKRVKGKKGRFKVTKKKITAESIKKGSATGGIKINSQKLLAGGIKPQLALPSGSPGQGNNPLTEISNSLSEIIKNLVLLNKLTKQSADSKRIAAEKQNRSNLESGLEKRLGGMAKIGEKLLAPVKSLLQKIIDFIVGVFLGRALYKLIEWIGNKENQSKFSSILKFLRDYWPALLGAYFLFGTTLGGFVRSISGILIRGVAQFAAANPITAGVIAAAAVMTGVGINQINQKKDRREQLFGKEDQSKPTQKSKEQQTKEGIITSTIEAGSFGAGQMAGLAGGGLLNARQFFDDGGKVSGEKGVDKIPAMLSDGEFVMSRGAVQKFGVNTLESMNAAGGGTNRPKILEGNTYAAGGGLIGNEKNERSDPKNKQLLDKQHKEEKIASTPSGPRRPRFGMEERLRRIEAQMQSQKALRSGNAVNIKGAELGTQLGKGYGSTYKGRDSIVLKNGAITGFENTITMGGKTYYAQKRGKDIIYSSNYTKGLAGQIDKYGAADRSYKGVGGGLLGAGKQIDKKSLPKTQIMSGDDGKPFVGHLSFHKGKPFYRRPEQRSKGLLENLGSMFDPAGAKRREDEMNKKKMREAAMNSLEYYRAQGMEDASIKKQFKKLGMNIDQARNDLKYRQTGGRRGEEIRQNREAGMPNYSATNTKLAQNSQNSQNTGMYGRYATPASLAKSKPSSSSKITPPSSPKVIVKTRNKPVGTGGGGIKKPVGGTKVPHFGATCSTKDRPRNAKILGIF